jgi:hypothetical protein
MIDAAVIRNNLEAAYDSVYEYFTAGGLNDPKTALDFVYSLAQSMDDTQTTSDDRGRFIRVALEDDGWALPDAADADDVLWAFNRVRRALENATR